MIVIRPACLMLCLFFLFACDRFPAQSGKGGVETTNGISGIVRDPSGRPVAHAQVVLVPGSYRADAPGDSPAPLRTETDSRGGYRFEDVARGGYNLESDLPERNLRAWLPGLEMGGEGSRAITADAILKPPGALRIPFADRHLPENARLFIPGATLATSIVGKIDSAGYLTVPGLAEGVYPGLMAYFPDPDDGPAMDVCAGFSIRSGDTTLLSDVESWRGTKTFSLDFTGAAGTLERLDSHPILLRLDSGNFAFAAAEPDGRDIRITGADGSRLPFQIELWDAMAKEAAIWIRLPTTLGQGDSIRIHFGRKDAKSLSDGPKVFDTSLGFAAVWHLGHTHASMDGEPTLSESNRDATGSGHDASAKTPATASAVIPYKAVAGNGRAFTEAGQGLSASMPSSLEGGKGFSVTFWMNLKPDTLRQTVLALGEDLPWKGFHLLIRPDTVAQFGPFDSAGLGDPSPRQNVFSMAPFVNRWAFVATVFDPAEGTVTTWIDGRRMASSPVLPLVLPGGMGVRIGTAISDTLSPQADYSGGLDEIRLYGKVLSGEAIGLEYSIQRQGSAVLAPH